MAGALVEHQRAFEVMSTDERQWVIVNTVSAIALFATAVKNRAATGVKKLLEFLYIFSAQAVKKFVAKDNFVEGETVNGVSIAWLGSNFKKNFLGKIEENVAAAELKVHKLLQAATDLPNEDDPGILPELGGRYKTALAHFFQLLAHKQQTEDFTWAIAYICDENNLLWAVSADWHAGYDGWGIEANSVTSPGAWFGGIRVISR